MSNGAALDDFIARLRALGAGAREAIAREAAPLVADAVRATAGAGTDPYGTPWRPRKDGSRAIPEAASAVDAVARGTVILVRVRRGAAIQNRLSDGVGRRVIPEGGRALPAGVVEALREAARRVFERGA